MGDVGVAIFEFIHRLQVLVLANKCTVVLTF